MRFARTIFLAPLALLAACGTAPHNPNGPDTAVSASISGAAAGTDSRSAARGDGESADPSRLKGLSPPQVRSVLGKPIFTRRDAPAEIWQYRGRACTLDLFLYDEGGSQTVAYYAVRSPQPVNESQCMGELVGRNQGVPTS